MPDSIEIDLTSRPLSTADVMALLRYRSRPGFFEAMRREGIPHIRVSSRRFVFPIAPLAEWMRKREQGNTGAGP